MKLRGNIRDAATLTSTAQPATCARASRSAASGWPCAARWPGRAGAEQEQRDDAACAAWSTAGRCGVLVDQPKWPRSKPKWNNAIETMARPRSASSRSKRRERGVRHRTRVRNGATIPEGTRASWLRRRAGSAPHADELELGESQHRHHLDRDERDQRPRRLGCGDDERDAVDGPDHVDRHRQPGGGARHGAAASPARRGRPRRAAKPAPRRRAGARAGRSAAAAAGRRGHAGTDDGADGGVRTPDAAQEGIG